MRKDGADRRRKPGRLLYALLAALLLTGAFVGAAAAEDAGLLINPDMILAQDTADRLELRMADGSRMKVRCDLSVPGRGNAGTDGEAPDYIGMLGYAVLPNNPDVARSSSFSKPGWQVPVYRRSKDGNTMVKGGSIAHKTPVLVTRQSLKKNEDGTYKGWLEIIRLDTRKQCYLPAGSFETRPYWELSIKEVSACGYSLAVYRESPGVAPKDETGKVYTLRDGTRVLLPYEGACDGESPEKDLLPVQGIVFVQNGTGAVEADVVYFREADLKLTY